MYNCKLGVTRLCHTQYGVTRFTARAMRVQCM